MTGYADKINADISAYQPSQEICDFTSMVKKDYDIGVTILNKPYLELNDRSVIDDENRGQMMFNAFVDTSVDDPRESWKWRGTRSMARNKGIAFHANLTANYLLPLFVAQNEDDEIDRGMSEVMQDIIEWMALPTNSNYQSSFLQIVFGMETNPVTFLGAEYCEVFQTIKEKSENGKYTTKEILDEVLSGFKAPIWSSSQVLISNAYERNIQKQRCIIKRRYVEKCELEAKWGNNPNWDCVQEGIKSIYSEEEGLFYDIKDDDQYHKLVAEETYLNRRGDCEVTFVNGIYMGEDDVDNNPIKHRDNRNAPKYNVIPFGFRRIGEHFFYYKSMMNDLGWDNMLYDALSEVTMNRAILEVEMPIAISGSDKIDSEVIFPNAVVAFKDKETRITPLLPPSNTAAGYNALRETEKSITDASVNETLSGQLPDASQKAFNVAQAQTSARKLIGAVGKSLAESIIHYGDLMKDIVINNITVPQVEELVGDTMKLKYRSFALANKLSGGKVNDKIIKFDESLIGSEMTDQEKEYKSLELLEESGYPKKKKSMVLVNPELFVKFKYLCRVDIEEMFTKTNEFMQPILFQLRQALLNDPFIDLQALDRKLLYSFFQSEGEELMKEQPEAMDVGGAGGGGEAPTTELPADQKSLTTGAVESGVQAAGALPVQ